MFRHMCWLGKCLVVSKEIRNGKTKVHKETSGASIFSAVGGIGDGQQGLDLDDPLPHGAGKGDGLPGGDVPHVHDVKAVELHVVVQDHVVVLGPRGPGGGRWGSGFWGPPHATKLARMNNVP